MNATKRDVYRLCETQGLTVDRLVQSGGDHLKAYVITPAGHRFMTVFALTPSDRRSHLNQRAVLRRKIKELDGNTN